MRFSSTPTATASSWDHSNACFTETGLPGDAKVLGLPCRLVDVVFDGDERRGLVGVIDRDGAWHRLRLLDVTITDEGHEAARLLAAFRRWWVPSG